MNFSGGDTLLYGYVHSDPMNRIDPAGLFDLFLTAEGEVTAIVGVEGAIGLVVDTDSLGDSGVFGTGGAGGGANIGVGLGGGFALREVEGVSFNLDVNTGPVSFTFSFDDDGFLGVTATAGPGVGLSTSVTTTGSLTIKDVREQIEELRRDIERKQWLLRRVFHWYPESSCELD